MNFYKTSYKNNTRRTVETNGEGSLGSKAVSTEPPLAKLSKLPKSLGVSKPNYNHVSYRALDTALSKVTLYDLDD